LAHATDGLSRSLELILGKAFDLVDLDGMAEGTFLAGILLDDDLELSAPTDIEGRGFIGGSSLLPAAVKLPASRKTSILSFKAS